jgi:hypothetical protein
MACRRATVKSQETGAGAGAGEPTTETTVTFDHAAPFFTAKTPGFQERLQEWEQVLRILFSQFVFATLKILIFIGIKYLKAKWRSYAGGGHRAVERSHQQ